MKLATWNVNSLNVRLPRLLDWLATTAPDVACLQETKLEDHRFPHDALAEAGYDAHFAGQKTYNGVAILARRGLAVEHVTRGIPQYQDTQQRVIAATIAGIRVICVYVPNGQAVGSEKYVYKLGWFDAATRYIAAQLAAHPLLAVLGDFNVAPEDRDVHDPALWAGQVLASEPERAALRGILDAGLADSFRLFDQPPQTFSWWDYRMLAFPKNHGLRIDLVLMSAALAGRCTSCHIDRNARKGEKPSDHAPVIAELAD
jgi:exodeoxyribonuclease III